MVDWGDGLPDRNPHWTDEGAPAGNFQQPIAGPKPGVGVDFMEDSGTGFVAVGTAHLLGEESLLSELREQGYSVQRYYAFKGENVIDTVDARIERTP